MSIYKDTPTKDGRAYYFRLKYRDIYGKLVNYRSKKYLTKKEAQREEALYRLNVSGSKESSSTITFDMAFNEYMSTHSKEIKKQSASKIYDKFKVLDPIKDIKINSFNLDKYQQFIKYLRGLNYSTSYSNKIINLLKKIITYSNVYHNTSTDVLRFIEHIKAPDTLKKEMDFFTYDEFNQFISVVNDPVYNLFFRFLYYLGTRLGETTALKWCDIDFKKNEVSINKTLTTKIKGELFTISTPKTRNSIRVLPLPKSLSTSLYERHREVSKLDGFSEEWFVFGDIYPLRETTIQDKKNKYCELAGLKRIRIHDFRHSCASFLINNGASIVLVSKYLGHSKISMTLDTYTHFYKNQLEDIRNMIDKL